MLILYWAWVVGNAQGSSVTINSGERAAPPTLAQRAEIGPKDGGQLVNMWPWGEGGAWREHGSSEPFSHALAMYAFIWLLIPIL